MERENYTYVILIFISLVIIIIMAIHNSMPETNTNNQSITNQTVIGNQEVLNQLNSLLIPLDNRSLSQSELDTLGNLVKNDDYASGEVKEMKVLLDDKEYFHIGHSIGFIYSYVKTGLTPLCPGHSISHYYVFLRHNNTDLATDNLGEAKEGFDKWNSLEQQNNQTYLTNINYTYYKSLINSTLNKIDSGNSTATDDEIDTLSDAPCVYI